MLFTNYYKKIGEAKGWEYDKKHTFGYENGYKVTLYKYVQRLITIEFKWENDKKFNDFIEELDTNSKKYKIQKFGFFETGIILFIEEFWSVLNLERFQEILDYITNRLKNLEFKPCESES